MAKGKTTSSTSKRKTTTRRGKLSSAERLQRAINIGLRGLPTEARVKLVAEHAQQFAQQQTVSSKKGAAQKAVAKKKGATNSADRRRVPAAAAAAARDELKKIRSERDKLQRMSVRLQSENSKLKTQIVLRRSGTLQSENDKLKAAIKKLETKNEKLVGEQQMRAFVDEQHKVDSAPFLRGDVGNILKAKYESLLALVNNMLQTIRPDLSGFDVRFQLRHATVQPSSLIQQANSEVLNSRFSLFNFANLFNGASENELNSQHFEFAFHGTSSKNSRRIVQRTGAFHPNKRGRSSSKHPSVLRHGAGEYFGTATAEGYEVAHEYSHDEAIVVALIVKVPGAYTYARHGGVVLSRDPPNVIVVRNPEEFDSRGSYCVPLCEIVFPSKVALSRTWTRMQYRADDGEWYPSDAVLQSRILSYFKTPEWEQQVSSGNTNFSIYGVRTATAPKRYDYHIRNMSCTTRVAEQRNVSTGTVRKIRFRS